MQKNIGTVDAIMRISCGLAGLAWSASRGRRDFPYVFAAMSAMKVAEGITRYCPMLALFGRTTAEQKPAIPGPGKTPGERPKPA
ncbi:YgaP family membrane protein [Lihuaxuella thermophila]|uniref:Inner membrane protein YgaP-like transmembrane domain-containing protein n=1 Tax=Lihuaxuella thermophila TaxID=1173111 RepID=A0A1H8IZ31_9BACL|nr:DUF2892 domain-containing protein [Lihuaxuella thermophila]SEN73742.1 Protein of unknown function [Lihuaxuella thermophila]